MKYLLFIFISLAHAQIDVVFDIDWSIVYQVDSSFKNEARVFEVDGQLYRVADGVEELMAEIHSIPEFRLSFFSGGNESRNKKLLKEIFLPNTNISLYEASHKVFSSKHLKTISNDETLPFYERFKKDLRIVNDDLSKVVLVDDLKGFVPDGQRRNLFWLGKPYKFAQDFSSAIYGRDIPKSELAWLHERNKMFWTRDSLMQALERHKKSGLDFVSELRNVIQETNPQYPTMQKVRRADLAAMELYKKFSSKTVDGPNTLLFCGSHFYP